MGENILIHYIPPLPPKSEKRVGIYCRVSTNSADQLKSFTVQVESVVLMSRIKSMSWKVCKRTYTFWTQQNYLKSQVAGF